MPLGVLGAALFGAAWAFVPGYLQAKRGSHVVITTIMFNFIAATLMVYLLVNVMGRPGSMAPETRNIAPHAVAIPMNAFLAQFGISFPKTPLNISFFLALLSAVGVWLLVWHTRLGYEIRVVGASPPAAVYAGISPARITMVTMAISGGLAGLLAVNEIMGLQYRLLLEFSAGAGFVGIAVALMGRAHPLGVVLAAFLFGVLYQGGTELSFDKPAITRDMIVVIQGFVILFAGALDYAFKRPLSALFRSGRHEGAPLMEALDTILQVLASSIRLATPLICACLAGLWSERAGVVDIGLEGKMLAAAFAAAVAALATGSALAGLGAGIAVSILFSLVHGYASISQRGNQIVSGVAINALAAGLAAVLGNAWYREGGRTPPVGQGQRFLPFDLPFTDALQAIPLLGPVYKQLLSGHNLLVWLAFLAVPLTWWALYKTRLGLRLRAVGENPAAVDTAGISVVRLRYTAVLVCGVLCGLGGAYLSIGQGAGYLNHMTAGKGFIALAALIFAKWRPGPALAACLLFGFLDAMAIRLQGVALPGVGQVPVQFIQALPYVLTVVLLAGFIGKATPPKASGLPYVKER